jgi:beta-exotoxin I transport system ATP-binding protein
MSCSPESARPEEATVDDTMAVQTVGLSKRFGRRTALRDLDLSVPKGTIFGYLGPNGAGKTTTIKLLVGLYRPSAGRSVVLGTDVMAGRDRVQSRIGYLPGDFTGYRDHTGERFLHLIGSLRGGVDRVYIRELADRFSVDLSRRLGTLSHGNRQKVGIIMAFMNRPDLLLLDEPTNGLDPLMQRQFLDLLRETRDSGRTVLLSSHVLSEVSAVADHVGILSEGSLLAVRSMAQLHAEAVRRVDLTFDDDVPVGAIRTAGGVREVEVSGLTARVSLTGSMAELVRLVAPYGVVDISTHERDLSDVFMSYYEGGTADAHRVPQGAVGSAQGPARLG